MRIVMCSVLILFPVLNAVYGQFAHCVVIRHAYYTTSFDTLMHYPVRVQYQLTKSMLDCEARVQRSDRFRLDPELPEATNLGGDYRGSGYDRGHNMPAEDNRCSPEGMKECFYYSNMCPQLHSLNAGVWKTLESRERGLAEQDDSILVWCGSVSVSNHWINRVEVPDYCWKIIFIGKTGETEAYSFRNDDEPSRPLQEYKVSVDSVYRLTGIDFKEQR